MQQRASEIDAVRKGFSVCMRRREERFTDKCRTKDLSDSGAIESDESWNKSSTSETPEFASVTTSHIEMSTLKSCGV